MAATDLVGFLACEHLANLERAALAGKVRRPDRQDPELEMIAKRGTQHEHRYLGFLRDSQQRSVVEIASRLRNEEAHADAVRRAAGDTVDAMRRGEDVIYQATFFDGRWLGYADFLVRVDRPSELGAWSYEVEDTKLARKAKANALLQLCSYSDQLQRIQGVQPERMHVVLGGQGGNRQFFEVKDYIAYYRAVRDRFEAAVFDGAPIEYPPLQTYPDPVEHCAVCRWSEPCALKRRHDDHLSLVAGMGRSQTKKLMDAGVKTVVDLSKVAPDVSVQRIGRPTLERLREQARMQVEQRRTGRVDYELLRPVEPGRGLALLPEPSPGDLFFDLEGDPFAADEGLEYLWGVVDPLTPGASGRPDFVWRWAHSPDDEKQALEWFVDLVVERLGTHPDMHVYHYAPYEPSVIKRLMGRYATREDEVDRLLRGSIFVDLYRVVRNGVRVSQESYSIKKLEPLYRLRREGDLTDAGSSILAYEQWLDSAARGERNDAILEGIRVYNEDDCRSNLGLRTWLEERRVELADLGEDAPRPEPRATDPRPALSEFQALVESVAQALARGVAEVETERSPDQHARWLLAQLLSWHRREDKAEWWQYYHLRALSDEELVDEAEAIGGLTLVGPVGEPDARAQVYRYRFDPDQEYKLGIGDNPEDPRTGEGAGTIVSLDGLQGTVDLRRQVRWERPHPTSLVPPGPIDTGQQKRSMLRLGEWVRSHDLDDAGPYQAAIDLLRRRAPRVRGRRPGDSLLERDLDVLSAARRLGLALDGTTLAIQGPPGSGKTYTGARMILSLVAAGKTVGIAAFSHKAIGKLLDEVCDAAGDELPAYAVRAIQRADEDDRCRAKIVTSTGSNAAVLKALTDGSVDIAAGTAWMWAREEFTGTVDALFVDEAGQMSLANVLAMSGATRNIVLLGDPQQLNQPVKGSHPAGAEKSALEHVLAGRRTIRDSEGVFLTRTWRMHPEICRFTSEVFYDGRLEPDPSLVRQGLHGADGLDGTGVRFWEVEHSYNRNASPEEVSVVADAVRRLLQGGEWSDRNGVTRRLTLDDILVVSPYNAHVRRLREALPEGARVGTVDKFQGQEAPIVFYSMATSTPEEAPRGMDFLYSMNRLNVATSRARVLSVLVCSPSLLYVRCRTPEQMRLANALARFSELGTDARARRS